MLLPINCRIELTLIHNTFIKRCSSNKSKSLSNYIILQSLKWITIILLSKFFSFFVFVFFIILDSNALYSPQNSNILNILFHFCCFSYQSTLHNQNVWNSILSRGISAASSIIDMQGKFPGIIEVDFFLPYLIEMEINNSATNGNLILSIRVFFVAFPSFLSLFTLSCHLPLLPFLSLSLSLPLPNYLQCERTANTCPKLIDCILLV